MHDLLISVEFDFDGRFFGMLHVKFYENYYSSSFHDLLLPVTSSLVFQSEMLLTMIHIHQYAPCQTQVLLVK